MSKKPLKFCCSKGCKEKHSNSNGFCEAHKPKRKSERIKKESSKLYNDRRWKKYSERFRRASQVCALFDSCGGIAQCVDHIIPVEDGGDFWDTANHQPLCNSCHARKSAREGVILMKQKKEDID